jgi:predicted membrane chloride channel (bestrophin family)
MLYLFFLPLALRGADINPMGTVLASAAVGFAMLGLDEISHLMEQPFRLMPLYQLSKNSMQDVGDALVCQPPPLDAEATTPVPVVEKPPYWQES